MAESLLNGGRTKDAVLAEMYREMQHALLTQTQAIGRLVGNMTNDVLLVELVVLDSTGQAARGFNAPFGSVAICNHDITASMYLMTVSAGGGAPDHGVGMQQIPAGGSAVINLAGHSLTIYGTPNAKASVQVFSKPQPPNFSRAARSAAGISQIDTFLAGTGNYQIPAFAMADPTHYSLQVDGMSGAGGSGSGRRGAAGTVRCGGGSGSPGAYMQWRATVAELLALFPTGLVPYAIGVGGASGAAVTTDDTNGNNGGTGGNTTFGPIFLPAGQPGQGGTNATGAAGAATGGMYLSQGGAAASTTGGNGGQGSSIGAGVPGGAGGGITSGDVPGNGGNGRPGLFGSGVNGGTGGIAGGAAPTSGTPGGLLAPGPAPGGGAASIVAAGQNGAAPLANSGSSGGGGGASLNGNNSGAGAAGASGFLRVICGPG